MRISAIFEGTMAKNSHIEWTHHTFNPWWGCNKVSPACDNCYAEVWAKRTGQDLWGRDRDRRFFGDSHWKEPLKWNEVARVAGRRERVFCASMADVFERKALLSNERQRLWQLIERTPYLDWLLLTKRPQHIKHMVPWCANWPRNVWIGTSVENQRIAEQRLPHLLALPAAIRFLSCEPLLGPLDVRSWFRRKGYQAIDWIIAGGESGFNARPMHPDWVVSLLHQCRSAGVPFHFKQWGHWVPADLLNTSVQTKTLNFSNERPVTMIPAGKKLAGRVLQGTTWNGFPHSLSS
jgi:protein gp37